MAVDLLTRVKLALAISESMQANGVIAKLLKETVPALEALEELAKQKHPTELDDEERAGADWEGGYAAMVEKAREALK